jgi:hypothetical protein
MYTIRNCFRASTILNEVFVAFPSPSRLWCVAISSELLTASLDKFYLSPPPKVCGIPEQAARYHILGFYFWVTRRLDGCRVRKCFSFVHRIPLSKRLMGLQNSKKLLPGFTLLWPILAFLFHCFCSDVCLVTDATCSHANTATAGISE